MKTTESTIVRSIGINILAAAVGALIATGVLAISSVAWASFHGYTIGSLYDTLFPRFRGPVEPADIPKSVYVTFFFYVIGAAEIGIVCRHFFVKLPTNKKR